MLQTIEVIIEPSGAIRPLESLRVNSPTKAILTLLETPLPIVEQPERGNGSAIFALLQTPRFSNRPTADPDEIAKRIQEIRDE